MRRRVCVVAALAVLAQLHAHGICDSASPQLTEAQGQAEDRALLERDQLQLLEEHDKAEAARQEQRHAEALVQIERSEHDQERALRESRRHSGYRWAVVAGGFGGLAVAAGLFGRHEDRQIARGMLLSSPAVDASVTEGKVANYVAYGSMGIAALATIIATARILRNLDTGEFQVQPMATANAGGVSLVGRF